MSVSPPRMKTRTSSLELQRDQELVRADQRLEAVLIGRRRADRTIGTGFPRAVRELDRHNWLICSVEARNCKQSDEHVIDRCRVRACYVNS